MANRTRKFELYKLTISGLVDKTDYSLLIYDVWRGTAKDLKSLYWEHGGKTHGLRAVERGNDGGLKLRFFSFRTGDRPDIIDVNDGTIGPNPMTESQTGVDYTHALLRLLKGEWLLVLEKTQPGLYPSALSLYINWLLDTFASEKGDGRVVSSIVVSLEPKVDASFVSRIIELDRISLATIRIVQPNPGWSDLDSDISAEAAASRAARADVTMSAKRGESLSKTAGIVGEIRKEQREGTLGFARIEGAKPDGSRDVFTSAQMVESVFSKVPVDARGQVVSSTAFARMNDVLESRK